MRESAAPCRSRQAGGDTVDCSPQHPHPLGCTFRATPATSCPQPDQQASAIHLQVSMAFACVTGNARCSSRNRYDLCEGCGYRGQPAPPRDGSQHRTDRGADVVRRHGHRGLAGAHPAGHRGGRTTLASRATAPWPPKVNDLTSLLLSAWCPRLPQSTRPLPPVRRRRRGPTSAKPASVTDRASTPRLLQVTAARAAAAYWPVPAPGRPASVTLLGAARVLPGAVRVRVWWRWRSTISSTAGEVKTHRLPRVA